MLSLPENTEIFELPSSFMWFGENGIFYSKTRKTPPRTLDDVKETIVFYKNIVKGRKVCIILDISDYQPPSKEARDYLAVEMPKLVKAMAILSDSPLGRMIANLFFKIKHQPYPMKMFSTEEEATQWIKQYL
jgi:hypothetical protein